MEPVINGIPIVQAYSSGTALGIVDVPLGAGVPSIRVRNIYPDSLPPEPRVDSLVRVATGAVAGRVSARVADVPVDLPRQGDQYALGNLIADAQRWAGKADVAVMNNGGIRADLPEGAINWGQVYQVQPFQNRLQRLTVKGDVLLAALENCVAGSQHMPDCHIAGVEVWYDGRKRPGNRINRTRLENGKGIDKNRTYTLVVSDFMATGGSGFAMLSGSPAEDLDVVDIDALIRYMGAMRPPIEAPAADRFHRTDK